ncbi:MAG: Dyp-type peroxidase [Actinomycetota bacterium]
MVDRPRLNRRRLLAGGAAAAATGATFVGLDVVRKHPPPPEFGGDREPFHGPHQAGVATAPQAHATFIALDLNPGAARTPREALTAVLKLWTSDAARLTQGEPALADTEPELALRPARLTVTVGLGPTVFDRIGAAHLRPAGVVPLPPFTTDRLQQNRCGGDLFLQICADDLVPLAHACRVLLKNVRSVATPRWRQNGFRSARGADADGTTMRNLMGQVDGTVNLRAATELDRHVWHPNIGQQWFAGGTVAVIRTIRAEMDTWDELDRTSKEIAVGRRLATGAPLTGTQEFDEPDFAAMQNGIPVIPPNAHIALARARTDDERFLRRGYNYDDPGGERGLLFVAYQRDPVRQFIPVQQRLAAADALNPWITTVGSATFAILPGVPVDGYLGQSLVEA